ncbi:phage tail protein [Xenorhabdus cabanillasii]|uniref:Similarities with bacteriophage protein n=1 Tax=Xenorhabdus cabanillasii JM26 TaxID=1427517 RepID=W1IR84_9GAMM|nr:phage tail protein [Xenorhabdus cabanillasii]PHM76431.1 tail fiber protein [Xenorhabdus cabanillasii JM26]CDL80353.1 Similarities with bacteriophage protein [Xenorhabdus cabanillasii JM26]
MSSVITVDFEKWKAQQVAAGKAVVLDEFVFANVPDLDLSQAISRSEPLPAAQYIVHRQAVNKTGLASENAVAYSVTLGTEVGNFDFNWIGLINKTSGVIGMITHAPTQKKIKTANGLQGNVLTRSFLLEFAGAAVETAITTTAETWQIDFTARLSGMDEMQRLINTDSYGEAAFFDDGFAVVRQGEKYLVKKGLAYVGGLRGVLEFDQTLNSMRNTRVYADFSYQGNLVSQWKTAVKITVANALRNYVDAAGYPHYVFAIALIDGNGNITDLRRQGTLSDRDIAEIQKTLGRVQQEYATKAALANGLNEKQPKGDYATNPSLNAVSDNANSRLSKAQNGADIPNKIEFVRQLGLSNTVRQAENAVPNSRKINSKSLISDITLNADDVQAYPRGTDLGSLPGDNYHGPFSCGQKEEWARGISVGLAANTGQIWIDSGATLHTRFLNGNNSVAQQRIVSVPIGATLEWQSEAMIPKGFMENNGREFDKSKYPELLKVFPDGRLPDDRGLFKRGLDTKVGGISRGLDTGRKLGTIQGDAIRNITGGFGTPTTEWGKSGNYGDGAFDVKVTVGGRQAGSGGDSVSYTFDASRVVPTAKENRPINKAVIYITRIF